MKSILFAAALIAGAVAQTLTINTPTGANNANECEPFQITWTGGTAPYIVTVGPSGGTPIATFSGLTGTEQTWTVNATEGTSLIFTIRDSTGLTEPSAPFTVAAGTDDTCLTSGGSSPSSSTGTGSTDTGSTVGATGPSSGVSPTSTVPTSTGTGGSTAKSGSSSTGSAKSSGSATNSSSAGNAVAVPAGVFPAFAAVLGAALIALLA